MILFTWGEHEEATRQRAWRWALDVDPTGIAVYEQTRISDVNTPGGQWGHRVRYIDLNITRHFALGEWHGYYDGPHCSFSLGFLHLNWSWNWCEKCMPPERSPCFSGTCSHSYHQET